MILAIIIALIVFITPEAIPKLAAGILFIWVAGALIA